MRSRLARSSAAASLLLATAATAAVAQAPPTPEEHLGFTVGADRMLADWEEITAYMAALARSSPHVRLDTLGETTLGRPFIMLTISSAENLERLERFRTINQRLADPRGLGSGEAEALIADGRAIVLITAAIHSTEVGAHQVPLRIAHRLATSERPAERAIRDSTVTLLVPSLNPDGTQLVVDWYERTLGTAWEGAGPPFLYHYYTGHDNNRDWYAFTQKETRLAVDAQNRWRPQIVHDIHQMGGSGARFFIPPWIDPVEPNVDPLLIQAANDLGTHMAWSVGLEGRQGVVVNATYDAWTPARAYMHYHGGVRVLTETASARMATPVTVEADDLRPGRNYDARTSSWNFPDPWPGGEWRLADIVGYMESGAFALLEHAAQNREQWLRSFYRVSRRAVEGWPGWPAAWVIPERQPPAALNELLRILTTADVEVRRAEAPFTVTETTGDAAAATNGGGTYGAGSYVVVMKQPFAAFAQTMLERQDYPDLRLYPGGPPRRPYDVTAHTLPLLLGLDAVPAARIEGGLESLRLSEPISTPEDPSATPAAAGFTPPTKRIALYQSHDPSMDEGWTRWVFDTWEVPYELLHDADIRGGALARFDALLLPAQSARDLREGRRSGSIFPEYAGGLGAEGVAAVREFVRRGGTLVALEQASAFAIEALDLPLENQVAGLEDEDFYIPGSILRVELTAGHPLAAGMPERSIGWFENSGLAFRATGPSVTMVGRYGEEPLLSGWALGQEKLAGAGALAEVSYGEGSVILFGFRPQYRAQSLATLPLLFNALR